MTDHDPRRVRLERVLREQDEDRSGMVIVWLAVAFAILAGIIIAAAILATAPRSTSHPDSRTVSVTGEGSSGAPLPDRPSPGTRELIVAAPLYRGTATWYCSDGRDGSRPSPCTRGYGPDDMVAAIDRKDSEFRKGDHVLVRFGDRSVVVRIVDTCGCADARVIDLTIVAFQRLAPWGYGVLPVTLEAADIPLPETDQEGEP